MLEQLSIYDISHFIPVSVPVPILANNIYIVYIFVMHGALFDIFKYKKTGQYMHKSCVKVLLRPEKLHTQNMLFCNYSLL
jgi:hypothetical protein